jgi:hypothetical protein
MRCSTVPLRSTGQLLSRGFVVLLRKSIPQNHNLKTAAELGVNLAQYQGMHYVKNSSANLFIYHFLIVMGRWNRP